MRRGEASALETTRPLCIDAAIGLMDYVRSLSVDQLGRVMAISPKLAADVAEMHRLWVPEGGLAAGDAFRGDIYSGLQVPTWSTRDREYAQEHLRIVSGLYGLLRPLDTVQPYRLEMGYRLPDARFRSLYDFWGSRLAEAMPKTSVVVDLTAAEYGRAILPTLAGVQVVAPKFLTVSPKTGEPTFVVVHAKIARGAFAAWLIRNRIEDTALLEEFSEIGYAFDASLSYPAQPVFIAREFGGLGLSVRLAD